MSATIETKRFSEYVSCYLNGLPYNSIHNITDDNNNQHHQHNQHNSISSTPILHIPGRVYSVEEYYYEDIRSFLYSDQTIEVNSNNSNNNKILSEEKEKVVVRPKRGNHKIPYDDMISLIFKLKNNSTSHKFHNINGAILIFLPGIAEIFRFINQFNFRQKNEFNNSNQFLLLPLHSSISNSEQKKVFLPSQVGITKIVVSTNIAEASITIPDVTIIIDSCFVKEMTINPLSKVCLFIFFVFFVFCFVLFCIFQKIILKN